MRSLMVVFLIAGWLTSTVSYGQDTKVEVGAAGAPSVIFLYGNGFVNHNTRAGFSFAAGATVQYNFTKIWSLHAEVLYEQKGALTQVTYTDADGNNLSPKSARLQADYLVVPVMARATVGKKVKLTVNAGPYIGVLLHQNYDIRDLYNGSRSMMKPIDAGISAGIGLSVPIDDRFSVGVEARNNTGLVNVANGHATNGITQAMNSGVTKTNSTNFLLSFVYHVGVKKS